MHRKVTQSSQPQPPKAKERGVLGHTRPESPLQGDIQTPPPKESLGARQAVDMMDKSSHTNPSLEAVGGNVVSTGLGALEILGKKAVDVISDVVCGYHESTFSMFISHDHLHQSAQFIGSFTYSR
jgi:Zn ribbon nucleic-acid-binding protein